MMGFGQTQKRCDDHMIGCPIPVAGFSPAQEVPSSSQAHLHLNLFFFFSQSFCCCFIALVFLNSLWSILPGMVCTKIYFYFFNNNYTQEYLLSSTNLEDTQMTDCIRISLNSQIFQVTGKCIPISPQLKPMAASPHNLVYNITRTTSSSPLLPVSSKEFFILRILLLIIAQEINNRQEK